MSKFVISIPTEELIWKICAVHWIYSPKKGDQGTLDLRYIRILSVYSLFCGGVWIPEKDLIHIVIHIVIHIHTYCQHFLFQIHFITEVTMHCPCLSRPSLESGEIFLVMQIPKSLHTPWSTLSLFLWHLTGQIFGQSQKKRKPSCQEGWKRSSVSGKPSCQLLHEGIHPSPSPQLAQLILGSSLCPLPAVTAPCLWLWLPEPVISSNQGEVLPTLSQGMGVQRAGAAPALGTLGRCSTAQPPAQGALVLTAHPRRAGKCPQQSWSATYGNVPGNKIYQGVTKVVLII